MRKPDLKNNAPDEPGPRMVESQPQRMRPSANFRKASAAF